MNQQTMSSRAWAEMMLLALIWGASFLTIRMSLDQMGPMTVVAMRTFGGALLMWGYVVWARLPVPPLRQLLVPCLVMGILNNALPFSLIAWGQQHIPSGLASILNASTAVFGMLIAAIVFADERLTPRKVIGVTLGFFGVAVVLGIDALRHLDLHSLGQLALIGGAVSYGFAASWGRAKMGGIAPQIAAAGMLTAACLIMTPAALYFEAPTPMTYTLRTWGAMAYLALLATGTAYMLYYRVLKMVGSGNLSLVTLLVAPTAILLGALVLDETLPPSSYVGFALIGAGLIVIDGRLLSNRI